KAEHNGQSISLRASSPQTVLRRLDADAVAHRDVSDAVLELLEVAALESRDERDHHAGDEPLRRRRCVVDAARAHLPRLDLVDLRAALSLDVRKERFVELRAGSLRVEEVVRGDNRVAHGNGKPLPPNG